MIRKATVIRIRYVGDLWMRVCLAAMLAGSLGLATEVSGANAIQWSQNQLLFTVGQGSSAETAVQFSVTNDSERLSVFIVPELRPLVTVSPKEFLNVKAGYLYTLRLRALAPGGFPIGLFDGTLHIRRGSSTLPATLKVTMEVTNRPSVQAAIGAAGGTLSNADGSSLVIPANSVSSPVMFSIESLSEGSFPLPIPAGMAFEGGIAVGPSGLQFTTPATLTIPLRTPVSSFTVLPILSVEANGSEITLATEGRADASGALVVGEISHLSIFAVLFPSAQSGRLKNDVLQQISGFLTKHRGRCFFDKGLLSQGSVTAVQDRLYDDDIDVYIDPATLETYKAEAVYVNWDYNPLRIPIYYFNDLVLKEEPANIDRSKSILFHEMTHAIIDDGHDAELAALGIADDEAVTSYLDWVDLYITARLVFVDAEFEKARRGLPADLEYARTLLEEFVSGVLSSRKTPYGQITAEILTWIRNLNGFWVDPDVLKVGYESGACSVSVVPPQEIVLQPGPGQGKDIWTTSVYSYAPGGGGPGGGLDNYELIVGGWGDSYYSLLEFDLNGMPPRASSARLELFALPTTRGGTTTAMYLDRITEFWDWRTQGTGSDRERLWWADRPAATQWLPGWLPAPTLNQWYSIDITNLYNAWQDGTHPNHGVQLRPSSNDNRWNEFYGSDYLDNPSLRPRLVVTPAPPPSGMTLIGLEGPRLIKIDPASGASTEIGIFGSFPLSGLAVDGATGLLFSIRTDPSQAGPQLFTIDLATGIGTPIGNVNLDLNRVSGIAFDTSGTLYGVTFPGISSADLVRINPQTGAVTIVGSTGIVPTAHITDIDFDPSGKLVGVTYNPGDSTRGIPGGPPDLITIEVATGVATRLASFEVSAVQAIAYDRSGALFGVTCGPTATLVRIDPLTGGITVVGSIGPPATASPCVGDLAFISRD